MNKEQELVNRVVGMGIGIGCCSNVEIDNKHAKNIIALVREHDGWVSVDTPPDKSDRVQFWVVPKTKDEAYQDSSGNPILAECDGYRHEGKWGSWSALMKPTHWHPLPAPPTTEKE